MRKIRISDTSLLKSELSFREKSELVRYLDRLGLSVIETGNVPCDMAEILFVKNASAVVKDSILCVPVGTDVQNIGKIHDALKGAAKPRLQVCLPLSTSQMEYVLHKKESGIIPLSEELVSECLKYCADVEFVAQDAVRANRNTLFDCITAAIKAGATTVTLCDTAGTLLPWEVCDFIKEVKAGVPLLQTVTLGVMFTNSMGLADACTVAAANAGAGELKVCCNNSKDFQAASLACVSSVLSKRGESLGIETSISNTEINKVLKTISGLFCREKDSGTPFESGVRSSDKDIVFSEKDSFEVVIKSAENLGYELSEEDKVKVFNSFRKISAKKGTVGIEELEAIIASEAMQVSSLYTLDSYSVTCGNTIDILAHVKLKKENEILDGISMGNGPIDASFLAIEKVTGCHYELDDFQIKAVTEGREAMGQTLVKLRKDGKIFSGYGISTDIVGSGIKAYLSALNKIAWEEKNR